MPELHRFKQRLDYERQSGELRINFNHPEIFNACRNLDTRRGIFIYAYIGKTTTEDRT